MPRQHPYGGYERGGKGPYREGRRFSRGRGRGGRGRQAHMPYPLSYGEGLSMSGAPLPPWGAPFPMMPMPYAMPQMWYGMPNAALPPQPPPWDASFPPMQLAVAAARGVPNERVSDHDLRAVYINQIQRRNGLKIVSRVARYLYGTWHLKSMSTHCVPSLPPMERFEHGLI